MDTGKTLAAAGTGAAIGSVIPGVGTAVGAGVGAGIGALSGMLFTDGGLDTAERERHAHKLPPQDRSTNYLPIKGNGDYDRVYGENDAYSVYGLDKSLDHINRAMLNYAPEHIREYCEHGEACDKGCTGATHPAPDHIDHAFITSKIERYEDHIRTMMSDLQQHAGEMWAERLHALVYASGGALDAGKYLERTEEVKKSVTDLAASANHTSDESYRAFRNAIRAIRTNLAYGVTDGTSPWYSWEEKFNETDRHHAIDNINAAQSNCETALHENQGKIDALNEALSVWDFKSAASGDTSLDNRRPPESKTGPKTPEKNKGKGAEEDAPNTGSTVGYIANPGAGGGAPTDTPMESKTDPNEDLSKKLEDLMNRQPQQMPQMPGGGMPGGGMPGGMPQMPQFGQDMQPPFPQDTPYAAEATSDEDVEPFDDEDIDDDSVDEDEEPPVEDLGEDEDVAPDDGGIAPVDAGVPEANGAAFNPESVEARTVDVGNGRQVEFPTSRLADTVRSMIAAGSDNPKSIYAAAAEAGYNMPPMGQDIGEMVPPSAMKEGDIIAGADNKNGVYLGNQEVLMEGGEVKRLSDVANFSGEHQGIFRLTEPLPTHAGLDGVVQSVDNGTPEPTLTGASFGGGAEPGVPTDDAVPFSTTSEDASSMPGRSTGGGGLDAGSAFAN